MILRTRRLITKNGNSRTIALPRQYLEHMHLLLQDPVDVDYDDETKTITIRAAEGARYSKRGISVARTPREQVV